MTWPLHQGEEPRGSGLWPSMGNHLLFTLTEQWHSCSLFWLFFFFAFPPHGLVLDTDHASSWLHPLHPQPMDRQAGWVFRKSNPPRELEKQYKHTAGPAAFLCCWYKIGFSFHLSLVNPLVNHWPAGQTSVGDQSRFQCVFLCHQSCCRLLWQTLGLAHPPSLKVCHPHWKALDVVSQVISPSGKVRL